MISYELTQKTTSHDKRMSEQIDYMAMSCFTAVWCCTSHVNKDRLNQISWHLFCRQQC